MTAAELAVPRCRNDRPLPEGESSAALAKRALERAEAGGSGALVRRRADGSIAGAILAESGRVCWAVCNDCPRRLSDILVEESPGLTLAQVSELVAECRRDHKPLGETLLTRGLVSHEVLRRSLLHHTCVSLDHLMRADADSWAWTAHSKQSYSPMLTFSSVEVLVGMSRLAEPARTAQALAVLESVRAPNESALALLRVGSGRVPIAQIGCEHLELARLVAMARQVDELLAVASIADLRVAVLELEDLAFAAWGNESIRYVLFCQGALAFNRLLSHVVSSTTIGE